MANEDYHNRCDKCGKHILKSNSEAFCPVCKKLMKEKNEKILAFRGIEQHADNHSVYTRGIKWL